MVSVCLPSDALLQHLPSYLGFSYLGHGVSLHGCSSKVQLLLLTLGEGYLLTTTLPDLQRGIAPLGPPAPAAQPPLLGRGVGPPGRRPWPQAWGCSSQPMIFCPWFLFLGLGICKSLLPFWLYLWKIRWRRERLPTPVFWPREFHGLCIVCGVAKSRTWLSDFHFTSLGYHQGQRVKPKIT